MFDGLLEFFSAWREIVHISEWTGLSLGALACIGALFYFEHIPVGTTVRAVVIVVVTFASLCVGETFGTRDKQRQWDAARASALEATKKHDDDVALQLDRKYQPQLLQIQKQAQANKDLADGYEKKMLAILAKQPAGSCQLGDVAQRLHLRR
jgi:hypothetical protein